MVTEHIIVDPVGGNIRQCIGSTNCVLQPTPWCIYILYITPSQCDHLFLNGTQISNSQVEVVAGGGAKEVPEMHIRYV